MALDQTNWDQFKRDVHELITRNELKDKDKDPYTLSHQGEIYQDSGYSFGPCQWDIANNEEGQELFEELIHNETTLSTEEQEDIIKRSKTKGDPNALSEYEDKINEILRNAEDRINERYDSYLDQVIARVDRLVAEAKPEYRNFLERDDVRGWLCDYHNQLRISDDGPLEELLTTGKTVVGLKEYAVPYSVEINGEICWADLLDLYFHTSQAQLTPHDPARRFNNFLDLNGLGFSDFNDEEKSFFLQLKDLFDEQLWNKILYEMDYEKLKHLLQSVFADLSMRNSSPVLASISGFFDLAHGSVWARRDPIVFDLNGDDIQTVSLANSNAYFDLDGDGFRERTEWVSGADGFLAIDSNENGTIDDITELFGDEDPAFDDGFAKLETYDSNGDERIDSADSVFSALRLWQDANENGVTDQGELKDLSDAEIQYIRLNPVGGLSTFGFDDGSQAIVGDRFFSVDQADSVYTGGAGDPLGTLVYELNEQNLFIPWSRGYGNVKDLPVAVMDNPVLRGFVSDLKLSGDIVDIYNQIDALLATWAGTDHIPENDMRGAFSARKLAVLEKFMGRDFTMRINGVWSFNALGRGADYLGQAYDRLKEHVFANIAIQTVFSDTLPETRYDYFNDQLAFPLYGEPLIEYLAESANAAPTEEKIFLGSIYRSIETETAISLADVSVHLDEETRILFDNLDRMTLGTTGDDSLTGGNASQVLVGFSGDDTLSGGDGGDRLYGGAGGDNLYGGDGSDVVEGGPGDDTISDSNGNDTYVYRAGDGADLIYDRGTDRSSLYSGMLADGGDDTIRFGAGIDEEDVFFMLDGNHLEIAFRDSPADRITVIDWKKKYDYDSVPYTQIEQVEFADGTILGVSDVISRLGTDGNDTITWTESSIHLVDAGYGDDTITTGKYGDFVNGGHGNDILNAGDGSDVVEGGPGDDTISDSNGNDTYLYNAGDGADVIYDRGTDRSSLYSGMLADGGDDTIRFGAGIDEEDVFFMLDGNHLQITFRDAPEDRITITDWKKTYDYDSVPYTRIEHVEFANGTSYEVNDIFSRLGTDGDDTITWTESSIHLVDAGDGDDTITTGKYGDFINGGDGNDTISAGYGSDSIIGGTGNDMINGGDGNDLVEGGPGDDTISDSNGNDTYVYNAGDGADVIYDRGTNRSSLYSGMMADGGDDTIRFGEGIVQEDVFFMLEGYDLQITFRDAPADRITVTNWKKGYDYYSEPYTQIEHVEFDDGTVLEVGDMLSRLGTDGSDTITLTDRRANILDAGAGDDAISTGKYSDYVNGGAGDDVISTGDGSDILVGGIGNDTLRGGGHNDVYVYNAGDGTDNVYDRGTNKYGSIANGGVDTLRFGNGIKAGDVHFALEGYNLIATLDSNPADEITMINWKRTYDYGSYPYARVENIEFSDGTVFPVADVYSWRMGGEGSDTIQGGSRVDYINAGGGDDIVIGGSGNDLLVGGTGSDIYRFARGFGRDIINNDDDSANRVDVIEFAEDIDAAEVNVFRVGDDLLLESTATSDTVTVKNHYSQDGENTHVIDEVRFLANGIAWSFETLKIKALEGTAGDDNLSGFATDDRIDGLGGNDSLYGGGGADTIIGGDGNDHIQGGGGSDYLEGSAGEDLIEGGLDDDILIGGVGNDILNGGLGDDTYVIQPGAGLDTFSDPGGNDTLKVEGTLAEDVLIDIDEDHVVVTLPGGASAVLTHWSMVENRIENIAFDDGQEYSIEAFLLPQVSSYELTLDEDTAANGTIEVSGGYGAIHYAVLQDSANGMFTLDTDGRWQYQPDEHYFGVDQVKVTAENDFGNSAVSAIQFTVNPVNDAPEFVDLSPDPYILQDIRNCEGKLTAADVDGDPLHFSVIEAPANGTLTVDEAGSWQYTALDLFIGTDGAKVNVSDGNGGTAEAVLHFDIRVSSPEIDDFVLPLLEDEEVAGTIDVNNPSGDLLFFEIDKEAANGNFVLRDDRSFKYTPHTDYNGDDSVILTVINEYGLSDTARLTFDIEAVNDAPAAADDAFSVDEDNFLAIAAPGLLENDIDVDGDDLLVDPSPANLPENGTLSVNSDGSFRYIPNKNFNGSDSFTYTVDDGNGLFDAGRVEITVQPVNDAPVIENLPAAPYILQDLRAVSGLLTAADVDGDALIFSVKEGPANGTLDIDETGNWRYSPGDLFMGEDRAVVEVSDDNGGTAQAVFSFDVRVSPPDIESQTIQLLEDSNANGRIDAANPIGGTLSLSVGRHAENGNFLLNADNTFSYAPNPDYNGTDSVTVTVVNAYGLCDSAVLTFDVEPVNDPPAAPESLEYVLFAADGISGRVPASDVDADPLAFSEIVEPSHGTFDIDGDGRWTYTPDKDFAGEDRVLVETNDGNGGVAETELLFKVNMFEGGTAMVGEGGTGTILMDGISKDELTFRREQNDLYIAVGGRGSVTLAGYFTTPENGVRTIATLEGPIYLDKERIAAVECGCWWKRWREKFSRFGLKNLIYGSSKSETLFGANENDVLFGAEGNDRLFGKSGNDTLVGGDGKDHLRGLDGDDTLYGDKGRDFLSGGGGNDSLIGGDEKDWLDGGAGDDWLFGGEGDDRIDGDSGSDFLVGGGGDDVLDGGWGDDIYRFGPGDGQDRVSDRESGWGWWKKDSGQDTVRFGEGVSRENVAFFMRRKDLYLQYGDTDIVKIDQQLHSRSGIERFELTDGSYLTDADVNGIIQQMAAYAVKEGLCLHSVQDVRNNEELMTLIAGSWNTT